jgi:SPP1 family predicted phage head-tail adaptor
MNAGALRHSVIVQFATDTVKESGQTEKTWSQYANRFAEILTPSGEKFFGMDKFNAKVTHVVRIRWLDGITEKMRVMWGVRILNIVFISEDKDHGRWMWLNCLEEKA